MKPRTQGHSQGHLHSKSCCSSGCCGSRVLDVSRRQFLASAGAVAVGGSMIPQFSASSAPVPLSTVSKNNKPLRMQPVLVYQHHQYHEAASWRPWSGLITEEHAQEERNRIQSELAQLQASADFSLELLPLQSASTLEEARALAAAEHDGVIMFGASGDTGLLIALANPAKHNLMFVRHRTGPAYLWYEIIHPRFLRRETDSPQGTGGMGYQDVVVDDYNELLWRLRALHGLKNIRGKKIIAIGGASGWDRGSASEGPQRARELWNMEIIEIPYEEMGQRIQAARANEGLVRQCTEAARDYLSRPGITLLPRQEKLTTEELLAGKGSPATIEAMKTFVDNAFILTEVFRSLMKEHDTDAITIGQCMGTIMPMAETTACLCLTLINDEGGLAFCESDFVVIPSGILLHYISEKPVFFCNPTFPHENTITVAHCTAPTRMDGQQAESMYIRTHFESDYGAAPKVTFRLGQTMTALIPDFASRRWLGFEGEVVENPAMDICTSQIDLRINGDANRLAEEMRGFHWMVCYGNYLREVGYVLNKAGIDWLNLSA